MSASQARRRRTSERQPAVKGEGYGGLRRNSEVASPRRAHASMRPSCLRTASPDCQVLAETVRHPAELSRLNSVPLVSRSSHPPLPMPLCPTIIEGHVPRGVLLSMFSPDDAQHASHR